MNMYGMLVTILHKYLLEKYFCFAPKFVQKTLLFPIEQVTILFPQESSLKTALKPKSSHFSLLFCQKVIFC